jgi:endonuclease/exonuclease/phosphatase family metal-dependent hydrolase
MSAARLRLMTYNIRHGRGVDGRVDLGRIADVIREHDPDVVLLQEVDHYRFRTGTVDQSDVLARRLGMDARFAACMDHDDDGHYGIATLTRVPVVSSLQVALPRGKGLRLSEPRSALVTRLAWLDGEVDVINTHLSLRPAERALQGPALRALGEHHGHDHGLVVGGDFNCGPGSSVLRGLLDHFQRVHESGPTWPSRFPFLRLDHVLYRGDLAHSDARTVADPLARRASDHLPLIVDFAASGARATSSAS